MPNTNVGSGNYQVKAGDCMASIAFEHGFFWQTLWDLPENAELKRVRKDPYVLLPQDQVYIPEMREKAVSCPTDRTHRFSLKGVPERLKLVITDEDDNPVAHQPYVLEIDRDKRFEGRTDQNGLIEHAIPPTARKGHLLVGKGDDIREYYLGLGHLDPIEEVTGVQARLLNLGFYDGVVDGKFNSRTRTAILLFQEKCQLPLTGNNDAPMQAKLKELYGC